MRREREREGKRERDREELDVCLSRREETAPLTHLLGDAEKQM